MVADVEESRMGRVTARVLAIIGLLLAGPSCRAAETVRVATWNLKAFGRGTAVEPARLRRAQAVVEKLQADVVAVQEMENRATMEQLFPPPDWQCVIDDDDADGLQLAVAVHRPLTVATQDGDLDADDPDYLFPGQQYDWLFPYRRDALAVAIHVPGRALPFGIITVHLKARSGGRATTEERRVGAATELALRLRARFGRSAYVLLGDFNDNPDDRSMNILEQGDPDAVFEVENRPDPFLANLTESLAADGRVSWGRDDQDVKDGRIDTRDPGSRQRNADLRGTDEHTGDSLFDQLLVSQVLLPAYVPDSVHVFDDPIAVEGGWDHCPSDHLPVYADFVFD